MPTLRPRTILATTVAVLLLAAPAVAADWQEIASNYLGEGAADDLCGSALAMSGDLIVVGAPRHDGAASNGGLAAIFRLDPDTGILQEIANLRPEVPVNADLFGSSVAIDGDVVVVGAVQNRSGGQGRAYVFERPADGWSGIIHEAAVLRASDAGSGDEFGFSVAIDADQIAVGARAEDQMGAQAGSVYVFEKPDDGWEGVLEEDAKLLPESGSTQYAGNSIALQDSLVVTGAFLRSYDGASQRGAAYVYARPDTGWGGPQSPTAILHASDSAGSDRFGVSVALAGTTLVVGAYQEEPPGANVNHGCIYVFEEPAGGWTGEVFEVGKLRISDPSSQCKFGSRVALDGGRVTGASLVKEAVYVFERPVEGWSGLHTETVKVQAGDADGDDEFGQGLAIAGSYLAVGAPTHDGLETDAGKVYLFEETAGVGVADGAVPGTRWLALQAMPNPFNPRTTVSFELAQPGYVRLEAVDPRGRRVALLFDGVLAAGRHERSWWPRGLASGVYHLVLTQGAGRGVQRVTLVK